MQKEVIIPIYDALVCLLVSSSLDSSVKYLQDTYDIEEKPFECKGMVSSQYSNLYQKRVFYLYINPHMSYKDYLNTVGHELFHLTQEILEDRGEYFKRRDANESYAYLQGYMLGENFEFWEKAYKKFNTKKKITAG